jgi:1,2-dihydroxy-3-keto-5-methylthiopentene dioxygenase
VAILKLEDGRQLTDLAEISTELAPLNIGLNHWEMGAEIQPLLDQQTLSDDEKEQVLVGLDRYFEQLKTDLGYTSRDLIAFRGAESGRDVSEV